MENKNLIFSTSYLEFINNIDNLVSNLLYSQQGGYTTLASKDAVVSASQIVEKFNREAQKLKKDADFENSDEIIAEKRKDLIKQIKKHYEEQSLVWADEVYQNMLDNCYLQASIHKNDKEMTDKIYARILSGASWISNIHGLSNDEMSELIRKNTIEFQHAMSLEDSDYIPNSESQKTDPSFFLKVRNLILEDSETFLTLDFANYQDKLSQCDINFLNRLRKDLQTCKINCVKDDILLVNTALDVLKIKEDTEKCEFIRQIDNDFSEITASGDKIDEERKITLVKRRMELFKNSLQKNRNFSVCEYFKSRITS